MKCFKQILKLNEMIVKAFSLRTERSRSVTNSITLKINR